jgi:hypothetical protein
MATKSRGPEREGYKEPKQRFTRRAETPGYEKLGKYSNLLGEGDFGDMLAQLYARMAQNQQPQPQEQQFATMPFGQPRPQLSPEQIEGLARQEAETQRQAIQTYSPMQQAVARRYYEDPFKAAQADVEAQRQRDYGSLAGYKAMNQMPELTPAARIAVQGPSATNQWAQLGAYQGIDPAEVARLTQNRRFAG